MMPDDVLRDHLEKLAEFNKTFIIVDMFQPASKIEFGYADRYIRDDQSFEKIMRESGLELLTFRPICRNRECAVPCARTCDNKTPMPKFKLYVYISKLCLHQHKISDRLYQEKGWESDLRNRYLSPSDMILGLDVAHFLNGINGFKAPTKG